MDAILAGACGYLLKDSSIQDLMAGIRAASLGESLDLAEHRLEGAPARPRDEQRQPAIASTIRAELSDREIEVLKLIANGKDNAMIAGELHISPKTVKNHISNILMKLQIDNRIQAAVYAVRSRNRLERRRARRPRARVAMPSTLAQPDEVAVGACSSRCASRPSSSARAARRPLVAELRRELGDPALDPPALGLERERRARSRRSAYPRARRAPRRVDVVEERLDLMRRWDSYPSWKGPGGVANDYGFRREQRHGPGGPSCPAGRPTRLGA